MPSLFLTILGHELDPDNVTKALGLRPSQWWVKGEKRTWSVDLGERQETRRHTRGGWKHYFASPRNEHTLVRKINAVTSRLEKCQPRLVSLVESGHEVYLISLVQNTASVVIPAELQERLGRLKINLRIDFWPP